MDSPRSPLYFLFLSPYSILHNRFLMAFYMSCAVILGMQLDIDFDPFSTQEE